MFWDFENSENLEFLKLLKEIRFKREKGKKRKKKKKKVCDLECFSIKKAKQNNEQIWVLAIFTLLELWWKNNEISIMGENEAGAFTRNSKEFEFIDTVSWKLKVDFLCQTTWVWILAQWFTRFVILARNTQ